jgi:hypothetical protein
MLWLRFKGMIYPHAASSYDDARRVADRKSIWMVEYLRARRQSVNIALPEYRRKRYRKSLALFRQKHFEVAKAVCRCMKIEQDESCPVGYPSLLCDVCDGFGFVKLNRK